MKKLFIFSILFFFVTRGLTGITVFSEKEKAIIYTNALSILEEYSTILNQMGELVVSDVEKTKSSAESFLELFVNRQVLLYNDLDPSHKLSEFYEAETYTNNLMLWYPDGLSVSLDLDNAQVSEIYAYDNNTFSLDIMSRKTVNGNFNNEIQNNISQELTFRIAFTLNNKNPEKFRIVGVRNASSNYAIDYANALNEVNREDFSPEDMIRIQSELKTVLSDYTNLLLLIGDPKELEEEKIHYKRSFLSLFRDSSIRVYNDIIPNAETNLIDVTRYLDNLTTEYPDGINNLSINADSARFGQVIKAEDGTYYSNCRVTKFFSGNYKGKTVYRKMFNLIFRISFKTVGKTYTGFNITGVDIASVDFYKAAEGAAEISKPEMKIRPVTRKGFSLAIKGSFGQTTISDRDIQNMSLQENSHSWNITPQSGYVAGIGLYYFINNNLSLRSGIEFSKTSSIFNLSGTFTSNTSYRDLNLQSHNKIITADMDSLVVIDYITVPLLVNYTSGKPGKIGYYAEGGFNFSIPDKANYNIKGNYDYSGYYPDAVSVLQNISIKELGYYNRDSTDFTSEIKMKGFNISLYASAGINIPLGYYSSITAGPEIILGISDILRYKDAYKDIFGNSYTHQPTTIRSIGFRISLNYKL